MLDKPSSEQYNRSMLGKLAAPATNGIEKRCAPNKLEKRKM